MSFKKKHKGFTSIYYATDLHGSEKCFLKLLRAAPLYETDVVIVGGDLTGKMVVPIIEQPDHSFTSEFLGYQWKLNTAEASDLEKRIGDSGFYPYRTDRSGMEDMNADPSKVSRLFEELMIERLRRWMRMAEERLKDTGIRFYITGGNDDVLDILPVLNESDFIVDPEDKVVNVDEDHEMISTGYSNITPWKCPRDTTEEDLANKIEAMASQVKDMKNCIFNLHVPPVDSEIDTAPKLDTSTMPPKPVTDGGTMVMYGAGSAAVRQVIEKYQPLLGLHGHIHESRGFTRIGKTTCINPGSEYGEGILRGVIVNVEKGKVKGFQLVSG